MKWFVGVIFCMVLLVGCQPEPLPNPGGLVAVTSVPTLDPDDPEVLCAAYAARLERDLVGAIQVMEQVMAIGATCGDDPQTVLYDLYVNYGEQLEQRGRREDAVAAYAQALLLRPEGQAALAGRDRLGAGPTPTPVGCDPFTVSGALSALPPYAPTVGPYVRIVNGQFWLAGQIYPVYGVNYFPRDYPGARFLTAMQIDSVDFELDLMAASGLNTLRVFLRHDDLFMCPGNGAIPVGESFLRLDQFIQRAAYRGFRLILVLNHDADLERYPLYEAPEHTMRQMAFIAQRYREEPTVMAYDLRNSGDGDYLSEDSTFDRDSVLSWLRDAILLLDPVAPNQYFTAGWDDDVAATVPMVDFVSFQHWGDLDSLRQEIAILTDATSKPIVLAAVGYTSAGDGEIAQRDALQLAFEAVARNGLAGWLVWTAFDHPARVLCDGNAEECPLESAAANRFGLWRASYFPKRAMDAVYLVTGVAPPAGAID